jgi:hypothetical protein
MLLYPTAVQISKTFFGRFCSTTCSKKDCVSGEIRGICLASQEALNWDKKLTIRGGKELKSRLSFQTISNIQTFTLYYFYTFKLLNYYDNNQRNYCTDAVKHFY